MLNPLGSPCGGFEGVGEVLDFVDYFVVEELHDADGVHGVSLVVDGVFGGPDVAAAGDAADGEAGGFAGVVGAEGLQVGPSEDALAGLWVLAEGVVGVDVVLGVGVACGGGAPVGIEEFEDACFLWLGLVGIGWHGVGLPFVAAY